MNSNFQQSKSTIALCTDTHFWHGAKNYVAADGRTQLQASSQQIQTTLLHEMGKHNPDLLIHLGDWVCGGGSFHMPEREFCASLEQMRTAFHHLLCPVYALPGNHDCPQGGDYSFFAQLWNGQPGLGATIDLPAARLVLLNTHGHTPDQLADCHPGDPISGWVCEAEMARLQDALATAGGRPVFLFLHQLLQPWTGNYPWKDLYQVDNRQDVLTLLAQYDNVRAVFQGHAHLLDVQTITLGMMPCTFVVTPSIIEYPMAWLLLELESNALQVTVKRLPMEELAKISLQSGTGQGWRAGLAEWQQFCITF